MKDTWTHSSCDSVTKELLETGGMTLLVYHDLDSLLDYQDSVKKMRDGHEMVSGMRLI